MFHHTCHISYQKKASHTHCDQKACSYDCSQDHRFFGLLYRLYQTRDHENFHRHIGNPILRLFFPGDLHSQMKVSFYSRWSRVYCQFPDPQPLRRKIIGRLEEHAPDPFSLPVLPHKEKCDVTIGHKRQCPGKLRTLIGAKEDDPAALKHGQQVLILDKLLKFRHSLRRIPRGSFLCKHLPYQMKCRKYFLLI